MSPIRFDDRVPFVSAVAREDWQTANEILQAAEERHGLRFCDIAILQAEGDQSDDWYATHLWPFLTETHFVISGGDLQATGYGIVNSAGLDVTPTWRVWGAFVAEWANKHWYPRPSGIGITEWSRTRRPWEYLDFYDRGYLKELILEYDRWCQSISRVLALRQNSDGTA